MWVNPTPDTNAPHVQQINEFLENYNKGVQDTPSVPPTIIEAGN